MTQSYEKGDYVRTKNGGLKGRIMRCSYANQVMVPDGSRDMAQTPMGEDSEPVYRVAFGTYGGHGEEDDDEFDEGWYDWSDWFRERELEKIPLLDYMAQEVEKASLLNFVEGDATRPIEDGNKLIVHVCNNIGKWGAGFVLAVSRRWQEPEEAYRRWFAARKDFGLGEIQTVQVAPDTIVVNMVAQHGIGRDSYGNIPLRYPALTRCLHKVAEFAKTYRASVHMPRIGCGLAGGYWPTVEDIIRETLLEAGVKVTVYDFKG